MAYKVIFVEDEIVTREGIRDNVDWKGHGFEFCGEAPDGEMALQLLQATHPDLMITDIKMPFMDGLQLTKIVRESMPGMKIIILSGHDEFEYAQAAIKLGVEEYLLKPVTVEDIHEVLDKTAQQLDQERTDQEKLRSLQNQVEENRAILRERFLLKLVVGALSTTEALEKSQLLGLDLIARYYLVVLIRAGLADRSEQFDYDEYLQVQQIVAALITNKPDVFLLKKDWEEFVLLMKGDTQEFLLEERDQLLAQIWNEVKKTRYHLTIGLGSPKNRLAHVYQSFIESIEAIQSASNENVPVPNEPLDREKLIRLDKSAVENFLKSGSKEDVGRFFDSFVQPLGESALISYVIKNYIFVDIVLVTAKFVDDLGGEIDQAITEFNSIEKILMSIKSVEQLREQVCKILISALQFRDSIIRNRYIDMMKQAKAYILRRFTDPELGLNEVAAEVNLSPSHFSVIFGQENGLTFKEYLTEIRIQKAKELLRTTHLAATEIADQIGYSDPHYFSYVFKKNTGMSPTDFRAQTRTGG